jgi:hypothetical protein
MVRRGSVMVRRGSVMVRRGSVMVRRGSVMVRVAQLVACRLAVRQARVRISAGHHREVFPTEHRSDEEMERGLSEWRRINVLYECDCMNVYNKNMKNKQKIFKKKNLITDKQLCYSTNWLSSFPYRLENLS